VDFEKEEVELDEVQEPDPPPSQEGGRIVYLINRSPSTRGISVTSFIL
jgi:hypothetical protein